MDVTCKNCSNVCDTHFCGECGQKMHVHRFDTKHIFLHEIPHSIFHLDKGFLLTTKELIKRPGHFIRDYIEGKRANHYGPIQYVFIIGIVIGVLINVFKSDPSQVIKEMPESMNVYKQLQNVDTRTDIDAKEKARLKELLTLNVKISTTVQQTIINNYKWIIFVLIPFAAFAGFLITRKIGYNFAENIVRALYSAGLNGIFTILFTPLNLLNGLQIWISIISSIISLIIPTIVWNQFLLKKVPDRADRLIKIMLFWIYFILSVAVVFIIGSFIAGIIYVKFFKS
jgi:Protein of unknown function (DUF3667)